MIQRRPWVRSASFESHAARYPRQHPPSGDRIRSTALPLAKGAPPRRTPSDQPPTSPGTQPRAGPLLRRSIRVKRRFPRGDMMRAFEENRNPSDLARVPANGSEGSASSSPIKIGSAPRHPGRGGGPLPFLRRIAGARDEAVIDALRHSCIVEKGRRVSVAAPSPEVDVAPGDPSLWPHGSAREGPARMTWDVSARLLATCSSGRPVESPASVWFFCLPFLGRAAAQRSDARAPQSTPGKVRRPADPSETASSLYGVSPFSAGVRAIVANEAGRVLLAGPPRQTLGNGGQEPTLHGGAFL
ncbi:hypothetical protein ABIB90_008079 [Bradyrhizobium sp. JR4.1]